MRRFDAGDGSFLLIRVNDDKALVVAVENRSVVFQGAVGALCASIAPAASTGLLRMTHVSRTCAVSTQGEVETAAGSMHVRQRAPSPHAPRPDRDCSGCPINDDRDVGRPVVSPGTGVLVLMPHSFDADDPFPFDLRREGPPRVSRWARWTTRSRMASATVGSPKCSCQRSLGS
jgi:hypothetical protein